MQMQNQNQYPEDGLPISSSASLAGFGGAGGGVGGPGYASGPYQTPSMVGGGDAYDDGASVAGSAMTFMDGPVAGRTSHYGLPKYPHQAKPDYRRCVLVPISSELTRAQDEDVELMLIDRFMVQRGKADVYLD